MKLNDLPKPFLVMAPMFEVTDSVFRQVIASTAPPDLNITEFVNVEALQSKGRDGAMIRLKHTDIEKPLIAQIWGKDPENFYKTAKDLVAMGFDGIDINMGCPEKNVVRNGLCAGLINNRELAGEIIRATQKGAGSLPVSVKTRLGMNEIDYSWHEFLLSFKLNMLSIHGRTRKEMSKVSVHWDAINHIRELRDELSPTTLIVGNGDVLGRNEAEKLAKKYKLDGIMIGRGVFHDPFVFAKSSPWADYTPKQKLELFARHVELFAKTWPDGERKIHTLNKFCKIYISGFDGAKEMREKLMKSKTTDEILGNLSL